MVAKTLSSPCGHPPHSNRAVFSIMKVDTTKGTNSFYFLIVQPNYHGAQLRNIKENSVSSRFSDIKLNSDWHIIGIKI
jgi:hypothetical protein